MSISKKEEEEESQITLDKDENLSIDDEVSNENSVINMNSIEDLMENFSSLVILYSKINENLKTNDIELKKDIYSKFNKFAEDINKEHYKFNSSLLKKSLKKCISKKTKKNKNNENKTDLQWDSKKKTYQEISEIMEINEDMISKRDIKDYIMNYVKTERLKEKSEIFVRDKNLTYFNIIGKLKILFEFIKNKANQIEQNKEKLEKIFPNNEIPEYLTFIGLGSYYAYFVNNN